MATNQVIRTWVNGKETADISVYDRGLQYGDGLFETMRMMNGEIEYWPEHLARLSDGCQRLGIRLDHSLLDAQMELIARQCVTGIVKLMVTHGESARGYRVDASQSANIICMCSEQIEYPSHYYKDGVDLCVCKTTISRNPATSGLKHLNRLENVIARSEWQVEYQEGLMCDEYGHVVEGTMSNVFFIESDTLVTPDITYSGVDGIMRQRVLDIAKQEAVNAEIRNIPLHELKRYDAAIVTNSLIGAWPVKSIDKQVWDVSSLAQHLVARVRGC